MNREPNRQSSNNVLSVEELMLSTRALSPHQQSSASQQSGFLNLVTMLRSDVEAEAETCSPSRPHGSSPNESQQQCRGSDHQSHCQRAKDAHVRPVEPVAIDHVYTGRRVFDFVIIYSKKQG